MSPRNSFPFTLSCALLLAALCLLSSCSTGSKQPQGLITEQQVSAFLAEMDKAANNKDIDAIVPMLSEDVQFKITVDGFGMTQNLSFNRDEYIDFGRKGFAAVDEYEYRRGQTRIKVEPDGQSASVVDEIFETTTTGGQKLRSVARTTSVLRLENGKLVLARSEGAVLVLNDGEKTQPAKF